MPIRTNLITKANVDGRPYTILLVDNPTIEDVLVIEMKLRAAELMNQTADDTRKVEKDVRDALIRLGIDR